MTIEKGVRARKKKDKRMATRICKEWSSGKTTQRQILAHSRLDFFLTALVFFPISILSVYEFNEGVDEVGERSGEGKDVDGKSNIGDLLYSRKRISFFALLETRHESEKVQEKKEVGFRCAETGVGVGGVR